LYGNKNHQNSNGTRVNLNDLSVLNRGVPKKKSIDSESVIRSERYEQILFITWLRKMKIPAYHIPNGGSRGGKMINGKWVPLEAINLKKMGLEKGVPDIHLIQARKGYHSLYIEMKRCDGGKGLSHEQKYWFELLKKEGHCVMEAHGFDEAKKIVENYLSE